MKTILLALAILLGGTAVALANCHSETYFVNGKITTCWVCWYGNQKTVTCS